MGVGLFCVGGGWWWGSAYNAVFEGLGGSHNI